MDEIPVAEKAPVKRSREFIAENRFIHNSRRLKYNYGCTKISNWQRELHLEQILPMSQTKTLGQFKKN